MQTKRVMTWLAVAGLVAGAAVFGVAQAVDGSGGGSGGSPGPGRAMHGGGFGGMGPMRGLMRDLDLTDEQRTQLRSIAKTSWERSAARRAELESLRKQIETTVIANGFNEAEIRGLIEARSSLLADTMVDVVRAMAEMRSVLTPEQQKRFDERRAESESRRGERKARHPGRES